MPGFREHSDEPNGSVIFRKPTPGDMPHYELPDNQLVHGASLSNRRLWVNTKSNGSVESIFYNALGLDLLGSVVVTYAAPKQVIVGLVPSPSCMTEQCTGYYLLTPEGLGTTSIYPLSQKHSFSLSGNLEVEETLFVPRLEAADPPLAMQQISVSNRSHDDVSLLLTVHVDVGGDTPDDLLARYDEGRNALIVCNQSHPEHCRMIGFNRPGMVYELTMDESDSYATFVSGASTSRQHEQKGRVAKLATRIEIKAGQSAQTTLKLATTHLGEDEAAQWYTVCTDFQEFNREAIRQLNPAASRSSVETPDPVINQGVFWSKINMLRVMADYPEGPAFTNEPGVSSNVVGRDVAWFVTGGDYLSHHFSTSLLTKFAEKQYPNGKIPEYYNALDGHVEDYGLSMNDDTPLFVLACAHHYAATQDKDFLEKVYWNARKAADYILSQRDERGLVMARADGQEVWGIASWRNVIPNCQINGAVTEINSECYAALKAVVTLCRVAVHMAEAEEYNRAAEELRAAINRHLINPRTGVYYLNIDSDGVIHADVTADEVFPVLFGVASQEVATNIIGRLRADDFMTEAGLRTVSRNSPDYEPSGLVGLKGGVWPGVAFWYAFAAASVNPEFMVEALHASYSHYLTDPLKNNTVPGQFSEWFDGESLVNRGMRLSPWEPPRLLWAAVEGLCGTRAKPEGGFRVSPSRPRDWKWLTLRRLPCAGGYLTFFATFERQDVRIYSNLDVETPYNLEIAGEDVTNKVKLEDYRVRRAAFMKDDGLTICLGTEAGAYVTASVKIVDLLEPEQEYILRVYSTASGWVDIGISSGSDLSNLAITIEDGEFRVIKMVRAD